MAGHSDGKKDETAVDHMVMVSTRVIEKAKFEFNGTDRK
jgi:hypothetical protein